METCLNERINKMKSFYQYDVVSEINVSGMTWVANICTDAYGDLYVFSNTTKEIVVFDEALNEKKRFKIDFNPLNMGFHDGYLILANRNESSMVAYNKDEHGSWVKNTVRSDPITMPVIFNVAENISYIVDFSTNAIYEFDLMNEKEIVLKKRVKVTGEGFYNAVTKSNCLRRLAVRDSKLYAFSKGALCAINDGDGVVIKYAELPLLFEQVTGMQFVGDTLYILDYEKNLLMSVLFENDSISAHKVIKFDSNVGISYRICAINGHVYVYQNINGSHAKILKLKL